MALQDADGNLEEPKHQKTKNANSTANYPFSETFGFKISQQK